MTARSLASGGPVVVAFDGSDASVDGLRLGVLLADALGAPLRAVHVRAGDDPEGEHVRGALAEAAELTSVRAASAPRGLHEQAARLGAVALVLGSTHRAGLGRVFPGSVATRLLQGAPCAVAIAPRGYASSAPPDFRVVEIAFDGSREAWRAAAEGGAIAAAAGATVRMFAVAESHPAGAAMAQAGGTAVPPTDRRALADYLGDQLSAARESLPPSLRPDARVLRGDAVRQLLGEAEKGVDLLVMGSRGYGPIHYALTGSVSAAVTRDAPCPVLLVPRGDDQRGEGDGRPGP